MLKKAIKIIIIALMMIMIGNILVTYTSNSCVIAMSDVSKNPNSWGPKENTVDSTFDNLIAIIATLVSNIGTLVSIISLLLIGIKFMLGSVEERAQYKQTMKPWLIGAILLFGMSKVPTILYDMSKELFK